MIRVGGRTVLKIAAGLVWMGLMVGCRQQRLPAVVGGAALPATPGAASPSASSAASPSAPGAATGDRAPAPRGRTPVARGPVTGFDRNSYPGDGRLAELRRVFAFVGYWLTPPPGESATSWLGKRDVLRDAGFGFAVLSNGRLDAEIKRAGGSARALGTMDGQKAAGLASSEGFPPGTILFLDQEEGGRLLPEQAAYLFGWTDAVAASRYKPGAYLSGQADPDGTGPDGKPATITTAADVRAQVARDGHAPVALWVYQDGCPPAPGCVTPAPALGNSGTPGAELWQYAQSPRRPLLTASCAKTYASDGNCYGGASTDILVDLDTADSADPSHGR